MGFLKDVFCGAGEIGIRDYRAIETMVADFPVLKVMAQDRAKKGYLSDKDYSDIQSHHTDLLRERLLRRITGE